jgi:diguanylate cyclase (GGDEF)-like protein
MIDERDEYDCADLEPQTAPATGIVRVDHIAALSTVVGAIAIAVCFWDAVPGDVLAAWSAAAVALAVLQWRASRWPLLPRAESPEPQEPRVGVRLVALSLGAGSFWGVAGLALSPADSMPHQAMLAVVLISVTALWLPLFAVAPKSFWLFAAPAVLPMVYLLLTSPPSAQATMGSLLLAAVVVLAIVARTIHRVLHADATARRSLYHQATHDALVGLVNRAEFHRRMRLLDTSGSQYAVLFIDLDYFKAVNDTAGHAVGDELLRKVGAILRHVVRRGDTAARLGGDEFAVVMRDCYAHDATRVAATILERIAALSIAADRCGTRVTASLGIACSVPTESSAAQTLAAADDACYAAKHAGRNRFVVASSGDERARHIPAALASHASI